MTKQTNLRTSQLLEDIARQCGEQPITVRGFMSLLGERTFALGALVFGLLGAIIPAASAIFCLPVLMIGIQLLLGRNYLWLPRKVADAEFSQATLKSGLQKAIPALRKLEVLFKPRLHFMFSNVGERLIGLFFIALSLVMLLPVPGLNLIPGMIAVALALAILERDGAVALAAMFAAVFGLTFVIELVKYTVVRLFT